MLNTKQKGAVINSSNVLGRIELKGSHLVAYMRFFHIYEIVLLLLSSKS